MKIAYCSDTHLDFYVKEINPQSPKQKKQIKAYIENILKPQEAKAEVLILSGDIGHYFTQDTSLITELKNYYNHIILTFGNHDMYLVSKSQKRKYLNKSWNRVLELKRWCSEQENIHFLDGKSVVIEGVSFGGAGMHWDGSYYKTATGIKGTEEVWLENWKRSMNDAKLILDGRDVTTISLPYAGYELLNSFDPLEFFKKEKEKLEKIEYCDVMISHYGPKPADDMPTKYIKNRSTTFYYFNGLKEIERLNCKFWIYGHTHDHVDEIYKNCRLLCNPIGYPGENLKSKKIRTFEIK
jgi:predicted phosphodiesterase